MPLHSCTACHTAHKWSWQAGHAPGTPDMCACIRNQQSTKIQIQWRGGIHQATQGSQPYHLYTTNGHTQTATSHPLPNPLPLAQAAAHNGRTRAWPSLLPPPGGSQLGHFTSNRQKGSSTQLRPLEPLRLLHARRREPSKAHWPRLNGASYAQPLASSPAAPSAPARGLQAGQLIELL